MCVVLDGSDDGSDAVLDRWVTDAPFALRWETQARAGQAAARNHGASLTTAPVILFLDDDVVPEPDLVMQHLRHHVRGDGVAVLGDCPVVRTGRSLYQLGVWAWWEDANHRRATPGHQPTYRDFCAGNVSLRRSDFEAVSGFDEGFRGYGGEDYELGHRLLRSGVRFVVDRGARGHHHHRVRLSRVLRATREEGAADVLLGRRHLEIRGGLRLMRPADLDSYRPAVLAFKRRGGAWVAWLLRCAMLMLETLRLRRRWVRYYDFLRAHAYWRGVRDALGSRSAVDAYRAGALPAPEEVIEVVAVA